MSNNKRDLTGAKKKSKSVLLDELDSLKNILDEEGEEILLAAPWEFTPTEEAITNELLPELDEAVEFTPSTKPARARKPQPAIPMLEEVALPGKKPSGKVPELNEIVESVDRTETKIPSNQELLQLVEMLVQRRLEKLKPALTKEVLKQLERFYPSLKNR